MSVSKYDRLFDVATALRPLVMENYDVRPLRLWAELNAKAQHGCGGHCGCTPQSCAHCLPLGAEGVAKVEAILDLLDERKK